MTDNRETLEDFLNDFGVVGLLTTVADIYDLRLARTPAPSPEMCKSYKRVAKVVRDAAEQIRVGE